MGPCLGTSLRLSLSLGNGGGPLPGYVCFTGNMTPSINTEVSEEEDDLSKIFAGHAFVNQISMSKPEGVIGPENRSKKPEAIDITADNAEALHG